MEPETRAGGTLEGERTPRSLIVLFLLVVVGAAAYAIVRVHERRVAETTPIPSPREDEDQRRQEQLERWGGIATLLAWSADRSVDASEIVLQCAPATLGSDSLTLSAGSSCTDIGDPPWAHRSEVAGKWWLNDIPQARRKAYYTGSAFLPPQDLSMPPAPRGPRADWRLAVDLGERRIAGLLPTEQRWSGEQARDEATWIALEHGVTLLRCEPQRSRRKDFYDEIPLLVSASGSACALTEWLRDCGRPPGLLHVVGLKASSGGSGVNIEATLVTFARREEPRRR